MENHRQKLQWQTALVVAITISTAVSFAGFAYSQPQQLTVATDKPRYSEGDTIVITGTIQQNQEPTPAVVQIVNPANETLTTHVPAPDSEGNYSFELGTDGWAISGTYIVHVTHADEDQEATFEFAGLDSQTPTENLLVTFSDGTSRIVDARMTNGVITQIAAAEESAILLFTLTTDLRDGELVVILPRELIDSKYERDEMGFEAENNFMVLADGDYAEYNETSTTTVDRTLKISIPPGTEEVMIGGSSMIPEFPQLVALLASVSILSLILATRLGKTRFLE